MEYWKAEQFQKKLEEAESILRNSEYFEEYTLLNQVRSYIVKKITEKK